MREIRDEGGKLICKADDSAATIEISHKRILTYLCYANGKFIMIKPDRKKENEIMGS